MEPGAAEGIRKQDADEDKERCRVQSNLWSEISLFLFTVFFPGRSPVHAPRQWQNTDALPPLIMITL